MISNFIIPLDYIILTICLLIILLCFWRGFLGSILGLLTWIGSVIITIYFYNNLSTFVDSQLLRLKILENYDQITSVIANVVSIPIIFLLSLFILKKFRKFISSDLDKQILGVIFDKFFGFIFGFVLNYIIFSTIIYFTKNSEFFYFLYEWIVNNSYLLSTLENYNSKIIISIFPNEIN